MRSIAKLVVANNQKRLKEKLGRMVAAFMVEVVELCHSVGIPWTIESLKTSKIWKGALLRLHALPGAVEVFYDMCMTRSRQRFLLLSSA